MSVLEVIWTLGAISSFLALIIDSIIFFRVEIVKKNVEDLEEELEEQNNENSKKYKKENQRNR